MNLTAKIKKLEREIEALWLACGGRPVPDEPLVVDLPAVEMLDPTNFDKNTFQIPRRRGRPPKVTNGN